MEEIERRVIHETLRHTKGDKTLAARLLGIAARTIYRKLEREASGTPSERESGGLDDPEPSSSAD
jgi:two-component system response regulator HydG